MLSSLRGVLSPLAHSLCVTAVGFVLQELFVETIAKDAYVYAQQGKRKTLQRKDLGMRACSVCPQQRVARVEDFPSPSVVKRPKVLFLSFSKDGRGKLPANVSQVIAFTSSKPSKPL